MGHLNVFSRAVICVLKALLLATRDARDYSIHHLCQQTVLLSANEELRVASYYA
jgi:hypothetical protein